jgi:micrococcal nuclease
MRRLYETLVGYVVVIGIIAIAVALVIYSTRPPGKYAELIRENTLYSVTNVLDGDTLVANVAGREVAIRLIGIDTPEVVDPRKPVQCYGEEASSYAKSLLRGQKIYIEKDPSKTYDKYGRVLGYVKFSNGQSYNEQMIRTGYAREYTYSGEKYMYQREFKEAQKAAKKAKVGLWSACPTSP